MTDSAVWITENRPTTETSAQKHVYSVYGIALHSEIPLPLPAHDLGELARFDLRTASASFFSDVVASISLEQISGSWYELGHLPDGSMYARWAPIGEFLISRDGRQIVCRKFEQANSESFHVYLLGHALSFALVKSGFEPLHATVVVIDGQGIGFLGRSGFGKSSLAASFLASGHRMLTDDLLLFQTTATHVLGYPGPARIKLFAKTARRFLGNTASNAMLNPETEKLILPLDRRQMCLTPIPLKVLYSLVHPRDVFPRQKILLEPLLPRQIVLELLKSSFNFRISDAKRRERQLNETTRMMDFVPVRKLSFPRVWAQLPLVHEAILSDVNDPDPEKMLCIE